MKTKKRATNVEVQTEESSAGVQYWPWFYNNKLKCRFKWLVQPLGRDLVRPSLRPGIVIVCPILI